jgi:signal transduction histidine kinase
VQTPERIIGVIHLASRAPRAFDAADRTALIAIGNQFGVAIEKARLHAQLKALNQELESRVAARTRELSALQEEMARKADALQQVLVEERRIEEKTRARIAHDLHDGVQQLIIGALFETQAAREALADKPETTVSRLAATQGLLRRIESEMRSAIYSLRPVTLDAHGLAPALREYAEDFARRARVACHVSVEGAPRRFNPDAEVAVFRIVQEALNNIETHARAQQAQIHFVWGVRDLQTDIVDDGSGFDFAQVTHQARTHLGLIGMQERAASVGGTLTITSHPGEGTRVSCRVPVNSEQ